MPVWICAACGTHYPGEQPPPRQCVIGTGERQWVPSSGQRWATLAELAAAGHRSEVRDVEPGLPGIGVTPSVAAGQRGLLGPDQPGEPGGHGGAVAAGGVGWNAGLIGDSTPLRDAPVDPSVPTRAEGLGELGMGAGAPGLLSLALISGANATRAAVPTPGRGGIKTTQPTVKATSG